LRRPGYSYFDLKVVASRARNVGLTRGMIVGV
jgi:hypothetical protein